VRSAGWALSQAWQNSTTHQALLTSLQALDVFGTAPFHRQPRWVIADGEGLSTDAADHAGSIFRKPPFCCHRPTLADYRVHIFTLARSNCRLPDMRQDVSRVATEAGGHSETR
jgi:hypothetical protein